MCAIKRNLMSVKKLNKSKIRKKRPYDNSRFTQCLRLLSYFNEVKPRINTFEARALGIMHPSGRIKDLRNKGWKILTHWTREPDANGVLHRIGLFVFCGKQGI
ncbi:MAG: Uncharacterized protein K0S08_768 [Gammaproteobacteria bacterium]|jgi:hypothetical protein|nr:Uncharacterized protein [Gammaproteobacteria bacterium]